MRSTLQWLALIVLGLAATGPVLAHEGHDHGAPPTPVNTSVAPRGEATSADFEMVAVARGTELEITLDSFRTNLPIENAAIEIDTPSGVLKPSHRSNGIYVAPAPFLSRPGKFDLAFTVTVDGKADVLATTLQVPAKTANSAQAEPVPTQGVMVPFGRGGVAAAILLAFVAGLLVARGLRSKAATLSLLVLGAALTAIPEANAQPAEAALITTPPAPAARDVAQRLADGTVFVPKSTQRILAIRTLLTAEEQHARGIELPARIIPDANASGLVQASVGGRLSPPEGGFKPLGTAVKAGDILAYVRPPLPSADATVQAQQARELDQQISIVARRVERYSTLAPSGAVAKTQLEDAQLELKGLHERRANLDRVNRTPEALIAPVSGVLASNNAVAGQMAEPSSVIFQIIDPTKLWVEALAFEPESLTTEATARVADGRQLALKYLGTGLADRNQAVPVQFAVQGDTTGLRSGQFVTVFAKSSEVRKGIAVPRSAVLRSSNGQAIVYEHTQAERFVPREVRTIALDGKSVLVVSGLQTMKRVVTQGTELLDQIR